MEGEGGLIEREGVLALSACLRCHSSRCSHCVSPLLCPCCQLVFAWPHCRALVPRPRCHVVVVVPGVSELGGDELGKEGAHCGVVSSFIVWRCGAQVAATSVHVGIPSCSFWGVRHRLGGRVRLWAVRGFHDLGHLTLLWSSSLVVVAVWCLCHFHRGRDHVVSSSVGGLG